MRDGKEVKDHDEVKCLGDLHESQFGGRAKEHGDEIEAEHWGGRALDPVLVVDERRFRHYSHPGPGLIRYVLADEAWLDQASEMSIRYQDPEGRGDEAIPLPLPPRLDP